MAESQSMRTVCLHTSDAKERNQGRFLFRMPTETSHAVKVALGSFEFPMTQWTVEPTWSLLYVNEGIHVTPELQSLRVEVRDVARAQTYESIEVHLPVRVNPIVAWRVEGDRAVCTFRFAHGLWVRTARGGALESSRTGKFVPDVVWWGEPSLIGTPFGSVTLLSETASVRFVSDRELSIGLTKQRTTQLVAGSNDAFPHAGSLYFPDPPGPSALTMLVATALETAHPGVTFSLYYDTERNRNRLQLQSRDHRSYSVRILTTELSRTLGWGSSTRVEQLEPGAARVMMTESPVVWDSIGLTPGCYGPCTRPVSYAAQNICAELERVLNRFTFPLPERIAEGSTTSHYLVFVEPSGHTCFVPVPIGRYRPTSLARLFARTMTRLAAIYTPGATFHVGYARGRFTFECEVRPSPNDIPTPAPFALALNHVQQFDPWCIGFDRVLLGGQTSYRSQHDCATAADRMTHATYRVEHVGTQDRLRVHAAAPHALTCRIMSFDETTSVLTVQTYRGPLPCAHGLTSGDVARLTRVDGTTELFVQAKDGAWTETAHGACPFQDSWNRYVVVVDTDDDLDRDVTHLALRVRAASDLASMIGQVFTLHLLPPHCNLCFDDTLPRCLPRHLLGAHLGATESARHGSCPLADGVHTTVPLLLPYKIDLEHPDYVLIYLDDGKHGTHLQHTYGAATTNPFVKLVLYPNFREERVLPRDTTMISGETLNQFTITVRNPNGTPYHFHGAEFSLSLNLIKVNDSVE